MSLAGDPSVDETTTLSEEVEQVSCRWCGATSGEGVIEVVLRADAPADPTEHPTPDATPDIV